MITVVTFKYLLEWYRTRFTAEHVNRLYRGVQRNYSKPFRFVCITDDAAGLAPGIEALPIKRDFMALKNPTSPTRPNCYPRLPLFDDDERYRYPIGDRFISIDLDAVLTGPLEPIFDRTEDFVIYKIRGHYCGSLFLASRGARSQLLTAFCGGSTPHLTNKAGFRGSDQAWFEYCLGPDEATFTIDDGVYGWQDEIGYVPRSLKRRMRAAPPPPVKRPGRSGAELLTPLLRKRAAERVARLEQRQAGRNEVPPVRPHGIGALPPDARIVFFYGEPKAWDPAALAQSPWISEHYR